MMVASTVTIQAQADAHGDLAQYLTNCQALEDLRLRWCAPAHIAPTEAAM